MGFLLLTQATDWGKIWIAEALPLKGYQGTILQIILNFAVWLFAEFFVQKRLNAYLDRRNADDLKKAADSICVIMVLSRLQLGLIDSRITQAAINCLPIDFQQKLIPIADEELPANNFTA